MYSKLFVNTLSILAVVLSTWSCHEETIQKDEGNYYPLEVGKDFIYERRLHYNSADSATWAKKDTITFHHNGDTIVDGLTYTKIIWADRYHEKLVRAEGSKYYELEIGYQEYKFLDTDIPVGGFWISPYNEFNKREYTIIDKNSTKTILGKVYKNVIEVQVDYYNTELGKYKYWLTSRHYYAKDIGEIYSFHPYPLSLVYSDASLFLKN